MTPFYSDEWTTIYCADALKVLRLEWTRRRKEYFDCVVTYPPYWTLDKHRRNGWFDTIGGDDLRRVMRDLWVVLKDNRHAYIMCDGQVLRYVLWYAEESGWRNAKPLVWDKMYFVMLDKGDNRRLNDLSTPDVWRVPRVVSAEYPTEKPVALMEIPILHSTQPGETVFDPFCGSGSTLVAARLHGRKGVGIDKSPEACELAAKRVRQVLPFGMPAEVNE